jgi:alkaline phosphatase
MAHNKDIAGTARDVVAFDEAVEVAWNFAKAHGNTTLIITADHETGGLDVGDSPDEDFIRDITASTDWMWGQVHREGETVEDVLLKYAGVNDLTPAEKQAIVDHGEMGISDALSLRANVQWFSPNGDVSVAPDEGDHTDVFIPVWAMGPGTGSGEFDGNTDNAVIGKQLFDLVSGVSGSAPACPVCTGMPPICE